MAFAENVDIKQEPSSPLDSTSVSVNILLAKL